MSNIKIQDLSVGDWVLNEGDKYKVMGITMFGELDLWNSSCAFRTNMENVEPIPITPEMLEKNGLRKLTDKNNTHRIVYCSDEISLTSYQGNERWSVVIYSENGLIELVRCKVSYIHQLQHAFRLAGVKEEIKL